MYCTESQDNKWILFSWRAPIKNENNWQSKTPSRGFRIVKKLLQQKNMILSPYFWSSFFFYPSSNIIHLKFFINFSRNFIINCSKGTTNPKENLFMESIQSSLCGVLEASFPLLSEQQWQDKLSGSNIDTYCYFTAAVRETNIQKIGRKLFTKEPLCKSLVLW